MAQRVALIDDDDAQLKDDARLFIALVKERYHGRDAEVFRQFKDLLREDDTNQLDNGPLLSAVRTLFAGSDYLIKGFECFLPCNSYPESSQNRRTRSASQKQSLETVVGLVNKAKETIDDPGVFMSFLKIVMSYSEHLQADRVKEEAFQLLKNYPDLMMDLSRLLGERQEEHVEPVVDIETLPVLEKQAKDEAIDFVLKIQDTVKDRKLFKRIVGKINEFREHGCANQVKSDVFRLLKEYPGLKIELCGFLVAGMERRSAIERQMQHDEMLFECEDDMYLRELAFHRILFLKDAVAKLIAENVNADPSEEIEVSNYLSKLDLKRIRREMKGSMVLRDKYMTKGMAVEHSTQIVSHLDDKIREVVSRRHSEDEDFDILGHHQKEVEMPEWDWHPELLKSKGFQFPNHTILQEE